MPLAAYHCSFGYMHSHLLFPFSCGATLGSAIRGLHTISRQQPTAKLEMHIIFIGSYVCAYIWSAVRRTWTMDMKL